MTRKTRSIAAAIALFAVVVFGSIAFMSMAQAATPEPKPVYGTMTGTGLGQEVEFILDGKTVKDWAGVINFTFDNNGGAAEMFCIQIRVRVRTGDRYQSDGTVIGLPKGDQMLSLLQRYPANTANTNAEAAARQLAIWVFSDGIDPLTIKDEGIKARVLQLIAEAQANPATARTNPASISISPATATAEAGKAIAYEISATAEDAGKTVTMTVALPAFFTDETNTQNLGQQAVITLGSDARAKFWVSSAAEGSIDISARLAFTLDGGTVFSHKDDPSKGQRLVMASSKDLVAEASATGTFNVPTPTATTTASPVPTTTVTKTPAHDMHRIYLSAIAHDFVPPPPPTATVTPKATATPKPCRKPTATPEATAQPTSPAQPTATAQPLPQPTDQPGIIADSVCK